MRVVTVSSKNQITLPKKDMDELAIKPSSKLVVEKKKGKLVLRPLEESFVESTAGALGHLLPPEKRGIPYKVALEETMKIVTRELAKK